MSQSQHQDNRARQIYQQPKTIQGHHEQTYQFMENGSSNHNGISLDIISNNHTHSYSSTVTPDSPGTYTSRVLYQPQPPLDFYQHLLEPQIDHKSLHHHHHHHHHYYMNQQQQEQLQNSQLPHQLQPPPPPPLPLLQLHQPQQYYQRTPLTIQQQQQLEQQPFSQPLQSILKKPNNIVNNIQHSNGLSESHNHNNHSQNHNHQRLHHRQQQQQQQNHSSINHQHDILLDNSQTHTETKTNYLTKTEYLPTAFIHPGPPASPIPTKFASVQTPLQFQFQPNRNPPITEIKAHPRRGRILYNDYQALIGRASFERLTESQRRNVGQGVRFMAAERRAAEAQRKPKLIWVLFIHRHGDRTPLNMAPKDKYNDIKYWPEGFGMLTNAGRMRMFNLGRYIRKRYAEFLTDNFREVYSRSSDVDRCIESSQAVLAGLYRPTDQYNWNTQLPWIPAPVHTVPSPDDYLLNEWGARYLQEYSEQLRICQTLPIITKLYDETKDDRKLLEEEMGYDYDTFHKFRCTYSTLDIEEAHNLPMPNWYTPALKQRLYRYAGIAFSVAGAGTERIKQIRCGHLFKDIINRMETIPAKKPAQVQTSEMHQPTNAPSKTDMKSVVHFSTHDSILASLLESLNLGEASPEPPGFGATFFFELYVDVNDGGDTVSEKYLKLFYMQDTKTEVPIEKVLPGCMLNERGQLTLNFFKEYVKHLIPDDDIHGTI